MAATIALSCWNRSVSSRWVNRSRTYWIFSQLAKRLEVWEKFSDGGKSEEDWIKAYFDISDLPNYISWEEFKKKTYYVVPLQDNYKPTPALRWFYEADPAIPTTAITLSWAPIKLMKWELSAGK